MILNLIGPFQVNAPFGTEIAFAKGLKQLGFKEGIDLFCVDPNLDKALDGMDQSATATIVFKSCVGAEQHLRRLKGPVIVYQPDDARFTHIKRMMLDMRRYSECFLAFDKHSVDVARNMGYSIAEELLLTADPDLYCPDPEVQRDIDVSFVGSLSDPVAHNSRRRMHDIVYDTAQRRGWKIWMGETYFNRSVTPAQIYQRSKVVLNHATDVGQPFGYGFGLQCRHFEVGMTKTCLLSNQRMGIDSPEKMPFIQYFDETSLISQIEYLLEEDNWTFHANQLYEDIRLNHMPIHRAGQIVNFVQRHVLG